MCKSRGKRGNLGPTLIVFEEDWHLMLWDTLAVWFMFQDPGQCTMPGGGSSRLNWRSSLLCWTSVGAACCLCCWRLLCFCGCCSRCFLTPSLRGWNAVRLEGSVTHLALNKAFAWFILKACGDRKQKPKDCFKPLVLHLFSTEMWQLHSAAFQRSVYQKTYRDPFQQQFKGTLSTPLILTSL